MLTRPLSCKYDPIPPKSSEQKADIFEVLNGSGSVPRDGPLRYQDSIPIDPKAIGVPWHSTIPFVRRSIHWRLAEQGASEVFDAVVGRNAKDTNSPEFKRKKTALMDVAVSFAIDLWPDTTESRVRLLGQSMAYIFLHDGKRLGPELSKDKNNKMWPI